MEQELTEARAIIAAAEAKHAEETAQLTSEIQLLEQQLLEMRTTIAQVHRHSCRAAPFCGW